MTKYTYNFGNFEADGGKELKSILGNKGAGLAEMSKMKIPVPAGFTISSEICKEFYQSGHSLPKYLKREVLDSLEILEQRTGLKLGCKSNPLLISVRSGAQISMPGMMETILNLGLNDETVEVLDKATGNPKFAYDSYRRFIEMYSNVVLTIDKSRFEAILENKKINLGINQDYELEEINIKELIIEYKELIKLSTGQEFPQDILEHLWNSILAVFKSWNTERAKKYRSLNGISDDIGTAVNIQAMVFGNKDNNSATGVAFTRNPSTGKKEIFGEYMLNAQGEDIVSGIRTPMAINVKSKEACLSEEESLEELMPKSYNELSKIFKKLEENYKDMQDVEFTIENGKCWILQTRSGKRTASAAIKIAVDMLEEGILNENQVLKSIEPSMVEKVLHPTIDPSTEKTLLTKGLPASPGAAFGRIALSSSSAEKMSSKGEVILVREETSPEDIEGINASKGVLTSRGGMTSHAAVVARGMGKSCITGAFEITVDHENNKVSINSHTLKEGDFITINGATGEVFLGKVSMVQTKLDDSFKKILNIASNNSKLKVRANAETIKDANVAKNFDTEGIGLCRTEHMFFQEDRINIFRKMILSQSHNEREQILEQLLPYQQKDFYELFKIMSPLPVTIRLLDPPLHEFLPHNDQDDLEEISKLISLNISEIKKRINSLKESNPMLGHRGCRLAITYPEIYKMQIKAIFKAVYQCELEKVKVLPEIMVPLVINKAEFCMVKNIIKEVVHDLEQELNTKFSYKIGSMIELPAAVINASQIAEEADFISFGTNDLTQSCLGISRDDSSKFLTEYKEKGILTTDPFASIEQNTVGELVKMAVVSSRKSNPEIKIGVCGEHGGDPESIKFINQIDVDYVSCSPFRIPIAKICAGKLESKI